MSRPFAVFDIDGTLIRWQLYHALADELAREGLLNKAEFNKARAARMAWKTRQNQSAFEEYEGALIQVMDAAMTSIKVSDFETASRKVIDEYKDQAYTYTRHLIEELRDKNYVIFAISASQSQVVGLVAKHYGFDDFGGSEYEVRNGYFTGEKTLMKRENKPKYLQTLVQKHGVTFTGSIGVGDSDSDIPMLEAVEQAIAFNPTQKLFEHAQAKQWKVVVERKNMVYALEAKGGSYILA